MIRDLFIHYLPHQYTHSRMVIVNRLNKLSGMMSIIGSLLDQTQTQEQEQEPEQDSEV
jgi:CII-binding regulator of phage lambda lysogenization HflD